MEQPSTILREKLSSITLSGAPTRIDGYRVVLKPGQTSGLHHHPGGVVGVVTSGTVQFSCGDEVRQLEAGDAFVEPPRVTVARFDNASSHEPATFIAYYPLVEGMELFVHGEAS
jgi:quercetin dioxygenase-like cupin family protein